MKPMFKLFSLLVFFLSIAASILFLYPGVLVNQTNKEDGIKYLVGVSQADLISTWRLAMNEEIKKQASYYPDIKVIFYDAGQDNIKQNRDIENMLEQKIDILIVTPNNMKYLSKVISKVYKSGIPVIVMGAYTETEDYTMNIYCDNYKIGKSAGEYVVKMLGNKGGTVAEVLGDVDSDVSIKRKNGFRDSLRQNANIKLEYVVVGYWSRDKTEERIQEIFREKTRVDAVFAHNDAMAIGAWRVAAYEKLKSIFIGVGGIDNKNSGIQAVNNGVLDATYIYPTGGREALENAVKILNGENIAKKLELSATEVNRRNIHEFIK